MIPGYLVIVIARGGVGGGIDKVELLTENLTMQPVPYHCCNVIFRH